MIRRLQYDFEDANESNTKRATVYAVKNQSGFTVAYVVTVFGRCEASGELYDHDYFTTFSRNEARNFAHAAVNTKGNNLEHLLNVYN